jgi:predicted aconitase
MEEIIREWLKQDLEEMIKEHLGTADNIHIAALGTEDNEEAGMSEEFAEAHRELAEMYRRMAAKVDQLIIDYAIDYNRE